MEEQLIHPFFCDAHGPLLLLQVHSFGLAHLFSLLDPVFDLVRMQGNQNLPEEVTLWKAEVLLRPLRFWQVVQDPRKLDSMLICVLDSKLRPVWDLSGWDLILHNSLLLSLQDILKEG